MRLLGVALLSFFMKMFTPSLLGLTEEGGCDVE